MWFIKYTIWWSYDQHKSCNKNSILAGSSPRIERLHMFTTKDTVVNWTSGVPQIILTDVQSPNCHLWYNVDSFTQVKPCTVSLSDMLDNNNNTSNCIISKCNNKRCKTCPILITYICFSSLLTRKYLYTKGYGDFNCKTSNVIYSIECSLGGLIYVGETQGALHKCINAHQYEINNGGPSFVPTFQ